MLCFVFFSLSSASFLSRSASSSSPLPNLLLKIRLMELTAGGRKKGAQPNELCGGPEGVPKNSQRGLCHLWPNSAVCLILQHLLCPVHPVLEASSPERNLGSTHLQIEAELSPSLSAQQEAVPFGNSQRNSGSPI